MTLSRIEQDVYDVRSLDAAYRHLTVASASQDPYSLSWHHTSGCTRSTLYPAGVSTDEIDSEVISARMEQMLPSTVCEGFPVSEVSPASLGRAHTVKIEVQIPTDKWTDDRQRALSKAFCDKWMRLDHAGSEIADLDGEVLDVSGERYAAGAVRSHRLLTRPSLIDHDDDAKIVSRWCVLAPGETTPDFSSGFATRASAKKSLKTRPPGLYEIVGVTRREDGSPVSRIEVGAPRSSRVKVEVTATVREVITPARSTGRQGWHLYGWAVE